MIMEQVIKGLVGWGPCHHLTKGLSNYTLGFAFFKYVRFFCGLGRSIFIYLSDLDPPLQQNKYSSMMLQKEKKI